MIELLRPAAAAVPDQPAIVTGSRAVTYSALTEAAESVAAGLRSARVKRFGIVESDPVVTWTLLAAASLSGAEACVYPVAAAASEVSNLRDRLQHDVLIGSRPNSGAVTAERFEETPRSPCEPPDVRPHLVLTSGTTSGRPRGARHDWSRLLSRTRRIRPTPDQRWLLAYGMHQFAGLQVLLHVAAARATLVVGDSLQPRDALRAMRQSGVTHASGTPTFWRFLLAELRADQAPAPELRQVTLGGEAVPEAVLAQVRGAFPLARISQLYAATEIGLSISVRDGRPGLPLEVLDGDGDVQLRVVDGELWVRSRSGMHGYHGEDDIEHDGWRATGDLVEVVGDRVLFRGRTSDVINVGGVKVDPLPIEEVVSQVPGVAVVRAMGRPNRLVGEIVSLDVVPTPGVDEEHIESAIRRACSHLPAAARPRSIRFVPTVDTTGTKLSRGARR